MIIKVIISLLLAGALLWYATNLGIRAYKAYFSVKSDLKLIEQKKKELEVSAQNVQKLIDEYEQNERKNIS